jgi:hypothetical protein
MRCNAWPVVVLGDVATVEQRRSRQPAPASRDVRSLGALLVRAGCSRTDGLRFVLAYLGQRRLTADGKRLIGSSAFRCRG